MHSGLTICDPFLETIILGRGIALVSPYLDMDQDCNLRHGLEEEMANRQHRR